MDHLKRLKFGVWILLLYLTVQVHGRRKYPEKIHDLIQERLQSRRSLNPGVWSDWSPWSSCSRTCGGGVSTQTRECQFKAINDKRFLKRHKKPSKDIKIPTNHCVGLYKRFQLCNGKPCPVSSKDFRSEQCAEFDITPFKGRLFQWVPYMQGPNKCELNCRAVGHSFYAMMKKQVVDGTQCEPGGGDNWICVSGMCKHVGCDGIIGSDRTLDACGECGGTNSTCRIISGLFTRTLIPPGYHKITKIPQGACNMNITEMRPSLNNLALRRLDGSYVFNGNLTELDNSGIYSDQSTKFIYERYGHQESVYTAGPLQQPLDLMLISRQTNYGIKYEYTIPLNASLMVPITREPYARYLGRNRTLPEPTVSLKNPSPRTSPGSRESLLLHYSNQSISDSHSPRSHRTSVSGTSSPQNGPQNYVKAPQNDQKQSDSALSNKYQYLLPASDERHTHHRHQHSTRYAWKVVDFTPCSKTCGGGVQEPVIQCMKDNSLSLVDAALCEDLPKPQGPRPCTVKPCPARWIESDWTECSRSCGQGVQFQEFSCMQEISHDLNITVSEKACLTPSPRPLSRPCNLKPCARWITGIWGKCNVDCGEGEKTRDVWCGESGTSRKLPEWECELPERPVRTTKCDMGVCLPRTWLFTDWSPHCSSECGEGVQTRKVFCAGENPNEIPESSCDPESKPESVKSCNEHRSCSGKWFAGPWSPCLVECGDGVETRDVLCVTVTGDQHRVISDSQCHEAGKPETRRKCTKSCQGEWFMTEWSQCSRTCGPGVQTRELRCLDNQQQKSTSCLLDDKPDSTRRCFSGACPPGEGFDATENEVANEEDPRFGSKEYLTKGTTRKKYKKIRKKDGRCKDRLKNCNLVVQARLCRFIHYKKKCCHSCSSHS